MNVKSFSKILKILIGLCLMLSNKCQCIRIEDERQMPGPDISALRDDIEYLPNSEFYLPAVMQCLHYYTEIMQYEILPNPSTPTYQDPIITTTKPRPTTTTTRRTTTRTTTKPTTTTTKKATTTTKRTTTTTTTTTTTRPTTTTTTTQRTTRRTRPTTTSTAATTTRTSTTKTTTKTPRPTTPTIADLPYTTEINIWHHHPTTVQPHKPAVTAPDKPPYFIYFDIPLKPSQGYHKPGVQRPQEGINTINEPNWKDPAFFQWFFQPKPKTIETFDENELQYLDPLPKKLLIQIHKESNLPFAILDIDNVNEFRKNYDDTFNSKYRKSNPDMQQMRMKMKIQMQQKQQTLTGRKKPPPTRPYVHMLMLYDHLKREAKEKKLHTFMGYSPQLLAILHETSKYTGDYQMKTLLQAMLDKGEVTTPDVLSRVNFILSDLENVKSETYRTLNAIPPLAFVL